VYIDICGLLRVNKTNVYSFLFYFLLCNACDALQEGEWGMLAGFAYSLSHRQGQV